LEGPNGEVLQVEALFSRGLPGQRRRSVNAIVARAPAGAKLSRLRLDLSGEDGREAAYDLEERSKTWHQTNP